MPTHERPRSNEGQGTTDDEVEVEGGTSGSGPTKNALDDDIDAILDEIDDVLEENAEEFVRGFVQKGGQ